MCMYMCMYLSNLATYVHVYVSEQSCYIYIYIYICVCDMYVQQCCYEKQEALASCPQRKSKPTSKYVHV